MAALRIVVMLIIGLAIYFRLFEKRLIFYPDRTLSGSPHIPYEDVHFAAADGTQLHGIQTLEGQYTWKEQRCAVIQEHRKNNGILNR